MNKQILRLAVPNIISNITIPLLGMVDLALLGHLESEVYIGAIALGGLIFNFVYWGFSFLRMGTSGMTAQAFGAGDKDEMAQILGRSVLFAVGAGLILIMIQSPLSWFSFNLLEGSGEVEQLASSYFHIRIFAAPAAIILYALTGWFIGMQNAVYPMIIALVVNLSNIGFNFLFIYGLDMKSDGAAYGTVIAQYLGLLTAVLLFFKKYNYVLSHINKVALFDAGKIRNFFNVNIDILIRTLLLIFALSFFTSKSAAVNDTILAVNTILFQFLLLFSYFIDGFAYAAEALVGKYTGLQEKGQLRMIVKRLFIWGLWLSIPFTLIYLFAGDHLLLLLTNNHKILAETSPYLFWVGLIPIVTFAAFIWDGVYAGATATAAMRNSMIVATIFVFLPSYYLLRGPLGNHGLWLALMLFMAARGISLTLLAKSAIFSKNISGHN